MLRGGGKNWCRPPPDERPPLTSARSIASRKRACWVISPDRSPVRYRSRRPYDGVICARLRALAAVRQRVGYHRLRILLRRESFALTHKTCAMRPRFESYTSSDVELCVTQLPRWA